MQKTMLESDWVEYRSKRREAKKTIAFARKQGTQELYDEPETKEEQDTEIARIQETSISSKIKKGKSYSRGKNWCQVDRLF